MQLTDRQLKLALNSVHERAMHLLDVWAMAANKDFRKPDGQAPTKQELDDLYAGHKEHLALVETIRALRTTNPNKDTTK